MLTQLRSICLIPAMLCLMASGYAQTQILHFSSNEYALTPEMQSALNKDLEAFRQAPNISITGHTDADGTDEFNIALGEKRATSVKAYLISMGVDARSIEIYSSGESKPLGDNQTAEGKEANRRVEVVVNWVANPEKNLIKPMLIDGKTTIQVPQALLPSPIYKTIDPTKANDVPIGDKGTVLHIPANAFVDAQGNVVKDRVKLDFTEYKNAAEMAFSEIPMTFHTGNAEMNFNSAGMFSLYGTSNGREVSINKRTPLTIDYALAKPLNDIDFYSLGDDNKWVKLQDIPDEINKITAQESPNDNITVIGRVLRPRTQDFVFRSINDEGVFLDTTATSSPSIDQTIGFVYDERLAQRVNNLIYGMKIPNFGVYNCDQVARQKNSITITPTYVTVDGSEIKKPHVVSVIDLNYNASFNFGYSSSISYDAKEDIYILLLTDSGAIYATHLTATTAPKYNNFNKRVLTMTEITEQANTSEKLARYLGLN